MHNHEQRNNSKSSQLTRRKYKLHHPPPDNRLLPLVVHQPVYCERYGRANIYLRQQSRDKDDKFADETKLTRSCIQQRHDHPMPKYIARLNVGLYLHNGKAASIAIPLRLQIHMNDNRNS